ncbi:MAG: SDR family NAD(P)-dependent oxidoreductase, partial [Alphaproteobacteria bacterium]|nr:SDR family NAD(P)-dependent oxidoreductase [Alphaproteobacteria bacterium]
MRLKEKRAVVTASGAGIGRASALAFHREGAEVIALDIDSGALESLAAEAPGIQ